MKISSILAVVLALMGGRAYAADFADLQAFKTSEVKNSKMSAISNSAIGRPAPSNHIPAKGAADTLTYNTDICFPDVIKMSIPLLMRGLSVLVVRSEELSLPANPLENICTGGVSIISASASAWLPSQNWKRGASGTINIFEVQALWAQSEFQNALEMKLGDSGNVSYTKVASPWKPAVNNDPYAYPYNIPDISQQ